MKIGTVKESELDDSCQNSERAAKLLHHCIITTETEDPNRHALSNIILLPIHTY